MGDVVYRSVSQLKQYRECPHAYYLSRVVRAWQRPAAWLPQGTAVHTVAERVERSGRTMSLEDAQELFRAEYAAEVEKLTAHTPNFNVWFASGPYAGERDVERRWGIGQEQVARYLAYCLRAPDEKPWTTPDGTLAVELGFVITLDGVAIRGYIDNVYWCPRRRALIVRDVKTGRLPGDPFQLAVYGVAVTELYGEPVRHGDYWMAQSGKPTYPYDLSDWSRDRVAEEFGELDRSIRAEDWTPKPDPDTCGRCSVASACPFAA